MLSKPPYPSLSQFTLVLKAHDQLLSMEEEEKRGQANINQAFYSNRGRSGGRGKQFTSKGRGFYHNSRQPINLNGNTYELKTQGKLFLSQKDSSSRSPNMNLSNFKQEKGLTCQIWGKLDHTALECQKRFDHAYQSEEILEALAALTLNEVDDTNIYADSGATSHILNDPLYNFSLKIL